MSETFRGAVGRKAVSRASAEELGDVSRLVVDVNIKGRRSCLGKGRKQRSMGRGYGQDAVILVITVFSGPQLRRLIRPLWCEPLSWLVESLSDRGTRSERWTACITRPRVNRTGLLGRRLAKGSRKG